MLYCAGEITPGDPAAPESASAKKSCRRNRRDHFTVPFPTPYLRAVAGRRAAQPKARREMTLESPYALFVGDAKDPLAAKTALGVLTWRRSWCCAQIRFAECRASLDLPEMTVAEAAEAGAKTLIVGVANAGGVMPERWIATFEAALDAGLDLASGLHERLADHAAAARRRAAAWPAADRRAPSGGAISGRHRRAAFGPAAADRRHRLLDRQDVHRARPRAGDARGAAARPISAPPARPASSSPATASRSTRSSPISSPAPSNGSRPANDPDHWDLIEGQGSLFHAVLRRRQPRPAARRAAATRW